jgi:hypothetical protein
MIIYARWNLPEKSGRSSMLTSAVRGSVLDSQKHDFADRGLTFFRLVTVGRQRFPGIHVHIAITTKRSPAFGNTRPTKPRVRVPYHNGGRCGYTTRQVGRADQKCLEMLKP